MDLQALFSIKNKTAVITGGSGALGSAMARGLAQAGVRVAILSLHLESAERVAAAIRADGDAAVGIGCDVVDRISLEQAREQVHRAFGPVDILINAAGGNNPHATTTVYSAAKAAVANFASWLAVYMAQEYSPRIRVKTYPHI